MSGFSSQWLALREPLDLAARNRDVEAAFLAALPARFPRILDLASGAGSTVAALSDRLRESAAWTLTDNDDDLVAIAKKRFSERADVEVVKVDLADDLDRLPFERCDGVTTSAFLDLVTREFLESLVSHVVRVGVPFLASLSYDGRAECEPQDPLDVMITAAMNAHQRQDKGFGAALGPEAAAVAQKLFERGGYRVISGRSDWVSDGGSPDFQELLLSGWCEVADHMGVDRLDLDRWRGKRDEQLASGELVIRVGHIDLAMLPA